MNLLPVNLVYLVCGTTFAWSSPVLMKLDLTDVEGSSVASMLSLGSILGPFVSTAVLDILGRKVKILHNQFISHEIKHLL